MTTIDQTISLRERAQAIAEYLKSAGRLEDAETVRALAGSEGATMSSAEAAELLGVTSQTVIRWLDKGVLIGSRVGERGNWTVDAASVAACHHRRSRMHAAKRAFEGRTPLDQAAFISGLRAERIAALDDDDDD